MDGPFFLGSPFQPKESKSLAQGPGCQPYAGLEPSMLAIPYAASVHSAPSWGHCQLETAVWSLCTEPFYRSGDHIVTLLPFSSLT